MWLKLLQIFGITAIKHPSMTFSENDEYSLLEINQTGASASSPMLLPEITKAVLEKYADQPVRYFNEYRRIKVIHLKSGTIRDVNLKLEI